MQIPYVLDVQKLNGKYLIYIGDIILTRCTKYFKNKVHKYKYYMLFT